MRVADMLRAIGKTASGFWIGVFVGMVGAYLWATGPGNDTALSVVMGDRPVMHRVVTMLPDIEIVAGKGAWVDNVRVIARIPGDLDDDKSRTIIITTHSNQNPGAAEPSTGGN